MNDKAGSEHRASVVQPARSGVVEALLSDQASGLPAHSLYEILTLDHKLLAANAERSIPELGSRGTPEICGELCPHRIFVMGFPLQNAHSCFDGFPLSLRNDSDG
jgi:hypothetical protein